MQSFLNRWRTPYLISIVVITAFFAYQCLHLKVDQDNRSMDADNENQNQVEEDLQTLFPDGSPVLFAVHKTNLLDAEGKKLIKKISADLLSLKGVKKVTSLADHDFSPPDYLDGLLISQNHKTSAISILLQSFPDNGESLSLVIKEIQDIATANQDKGTQIYITGLPLQKYEAGRLVLKDQQVFAPLSFLVLAIVLLLITRHFSGLFFPLLISSLSIIWTLGIYSLLSYSLNMITSLLPPVIMTLSVTTTIHIYLEWLKGDERDKKRRIACAIKKLYRPCLFATLTTAIGFLSLLSSDTPAVRQFGLFAALGVTISYLLGVSGLAVGLSFLKAPTRHPREKVGLRASLLERISYFTILHPIKIVIVTISIAIVSFFGIKQLQCNTNLLSFLSPDNKLYRDSLFIDEHLTGVNSLELLINKKHKQTFESFAELEQVAAFQRALSHLPQVKHSLSLIDLLESQGTPLADIPKHLPFTDALQSFDSQAFIDKNFQTLRLSLRIAAIGSSDGAKLINKIDALARQHLGKNFIVREAGGFYRVITESDHLVITQVKSFTIALVLILLSIGLVFRSIRFMMLAIIPNIIPLLMTAAIMGFFAIDLSTGTAMIASVVIGIAVDDTIHYLAAFKKNYHGKCDEAILTTTRSTGFALTSTTLALSLGFWVAMLGSFQPTVYFALLSGLTMWFALACDLLILPACLKLSFCTPKKN